MKKEDLSIEEIDNEINRKAKLRQLRSMTQEEHRAQSITIGTAGGGTTEITMRATDGSYLWNVYQPVEVVELINQLSANIGCHIHIQPRNDFSSWREWKQEEYMIAGNGFPPFANDLALYSQVGAVLPPPEKQPGMSIKKNSSEEKDVVATKKTVNKRNTRRPKKTS